METSTGADHLWVLQRAGTHLPVNAACNKPTRKLDAGNPPVRFDEGEGSVIGPSLLYSSCSSSIYWASAPTKEPIFLAIILFRLRDGEISELSRTTTSTRTRTTSQLRYLG